MELIPPKNEKIFVQYINKGVITHAITATIHCDEYHLCTVQNSKCVKTKYKSKNPLELEKYIYAK